MEADGAAVSKDDLLDRVWPDCEVGEANLSVQIAALRKAMGPTQDGGEWIVTVPRVGYRMPGVVTAGKSIPTPAVVTFDDLRGAGNGPYFADGVVNISYDGPCPLARTSIITIGSPCSPLSVDDCPFHLMQHARTPRVLPSDIASVNVY